MTPVRWLPVVGFEGLYEVSDNGDVRSVVSRHGPRKASRIVAGHVNRGGYRAFKAHRNSVPKQIYVHRAVLLAFVGPCPDGMECAHINGDPLDNRLENLRWSTRLDNSQDKHAHGTTLRGESHGKSKLTEEQVCEIRSLVESGMSERDCAVLFGVGSYCVHSIKHRKTWAHVQ